MTTQTDKPAETPPTVPMTDRESLRANRYGNTAHDLRAWWQSPDENECGLVLLAVKLLEEAQTEIASKDEEIAQLRAERISDEGIIDAAMSAFTDYWQQVEQVGGKRTVMCDDEEMRRRVIEAIKEQRGKSVDR